MSHRYRLYPTAHQEIVMRRHCSDARYVWNLALEQFNMYRPNLGSTPNKANRDRQLTEARQGGWLADGSFMVQQQSLRDFDQALKNWWSGSHRRPTWRKATKHNAAGQAVSGRGGTSQQGPDEASTQPTLVAA